MPDALYHLAVIALAALGILRGYRSGFTGQVAAVLGLSFGVVSAHVFAEPVEAWLWSVWPGAGQRLGGDILLAMTAASIVCCAIYGVLAILAPVLKSAMSVFSTGMLNSLLGSVFCAVRYLFFLSMAFNLLVDFNPDASLLKHATDHDGNVVEAVMTLAPAALGVPGVEELAHRRQLEEAKRISCNFLQRPDVIIDNNRQKIQPC